MIGPDSTDDQPVLEGKGHSWIQPPQKVICAVRSASKSLDNIRQKNTERYTPDQNVELETKQGGFGDHFSITEYTVCIKMFQVQSLASQDRT